MDDGLLVRVTTGVDSQGHAPLIALWLVATTDRQAALATVRQANPFALKFEISERPVQPGTLQRLRLRPGEARKL
jgi:hypothetical protein